MSVRALLAGIVAWAPSCLLGDEIPLHHLTCQHGSLQNSGSSSVEFEERNPPGVPMFEIEKFDDLGGYAAVFPMSANGESGASLVIPNSETELRLSEKQDAMTIAVWLKWNGPDGHKDARQGIVSNLPAEMNRGWAFFIREDGRLGFFWVAEKGGNMRVSEQEIPRDTWTHVAMAWDSANTQSGLQFYVNGFPAGIDLAYTGGGPIRSSDQLISIGVLEARNFLPLNGALAGLRIYTTALEADPIFQLTEKKGR